MTISERAKLAQRVAELIKDNIGKNKGTADVEAVISAARAFLLPEINQGSYALSDSGEEVHQA